MRTLTSTLTALTFLFIFVFAGCKKDNSAASTPIIITGSIERALTTGTWRVGTFIDNGTDKTNNFMDFKHKAADTYSIADQVIVQATAVGITVVWSAVGAFIPYKLGDMFIGLRVAEDEEREGLDITSHGESAYHQ